MSGFWSSLTAGVARDRDDTGSWISTAGKHPRLLNAVRSTTIWLYDDTDPARGPFPGSYVRFGTDSQGAIGEYAADGVRCFPSHFWDGEGEPECAPRGM